MAIVTFYGKPDCINNTRQKALLQASGHHVIARDLLIEPWTPEQLYLFFAGLPVTQWFNPTARAITTGLVLPAQLNIEIALDLMVIDPGLIRRPLLQVADQRQVGFDPDIIARWIGLSTTALVKTGISKTRISKTGISPTDLTLCPKAPVRSFATGGASLA
ncbi:ArsC/Spx/MgsR family protein [Leptolyngbya sp. PCC 6406]|uniref:ArsC/Spx/MgsR family protein n=1 Tax=Leptolyngbya sp. PCC 6406 TaxID=1173264 RepID=UPI0002ACA89E|nr:ArsC/Spx/MgsR family protein [Leptolyngbya sp. PCC 6406]